MTSFCIRLYDGKFLLTERDYAAQGFSPTYRTICQVLEDEASALLKSGIIEPLYSLPIAPGGLPGKYMSLEDGRFGKVVVLSLPKNDVRAIDIKEEVPLAESLEKILNNDVSAVENFIRNTGISRGMG